MTKVKYTEEHVRFILENYVKNEDLCVKETGHSSGSIKLLLQNIGATYGFLFHLIKSSHSFLKGVVQLIK